MLRIKKKGGGGVERGNERKEKCYHENRITFLRGWWATERTSRKVINKGRRKWGEKYILCIDRRKHRQTTQAPEVPSLAWALNCVACITL